MIYKYVNINEFNIDDIYDKVSSKRIEKMSKLKFDVDKKRSVCVEFLLNEMINECKSSDKEIDAFSEIKTPVELTYDEKGKPHIYDIDGRDAIHFSLSHSGDYVACMISDKPCGIDIEKHSEKREYEKIAARICTENEIKNVSSKEDFYKIWTLKESILKATGEGLSLDMKKIDLKGQDNKYKTNVNGIDFIGVSAEAPEGYSLSYVEKNEDE